MLIGHRSARRHRGRKSRTSRIAVPLAIPVAAGLALGIALAAPGGNHTTVNRAASTSASRFSGVLGGFRGAFGRGNFGGRFRGGQFFGGGRGDLAGMNATDAAGNPINFNQTPAQAAQSMNCTLTVPAHPLSARGLATPWQLGDGCDEAANGATEGAFVEATILSPNGQVQVYDPVVVNAGTQPAAAPAPPAIASGSQVIISVGFNGNAVALLGKGARQGRCIDALGNSLINQTPQCNAAGFLPAGRRRDRERHADRPACGYRHRRAAVRDQRELPADRPGSERQRRLGVPGQRQHRAGRAGHRSQRAEPAGVHHLVQRQ